MLLIALPTNYTIRVMPPHAASVFCLTAKAPIRLGSSQLDLAWILRGTYDDCALRPLVHYVAQKRRVPSNAEKLGKAYWSYPRGSVWTDPLRSDEGTSRKVIAGPLPFLDKYFP